MKDGKMALQTGVSMVFIGGTHRTTNELSNASGFRRALAMAAIRVGDVSHCLSQCLANEPH